MDFNTALLLASNEAIDELLPCSYLARSRRIPHRSCPRKTAEMCLLFSDRSPNRIRLTLLRPVSWLGLKSGGKFLLERYIWGLLSIFTSVISDDQLDLVLVKLVDYLGYESMITSAAAFTEV